jgi:hypothetical protein
MANGKIKADMLEHSTAGSIATNYVVNGSAKAFFYFDGTGTPAILASENGSSITDIGSGNYEPNVTSSFSSVTDYCVNVMASDNNAFQVTTYEDGANESNRTASKFRMSVVNLQTQPGVRADSSQINVLMHGELA